MSGIPTPNGASFIHAFSTIFLIFFSSSDHSTNPLAHEQVPLASASDTRLSTAGLLMRRGLRIRAASWISDTSTCSGDQESDAQSGARPSGKRSVAVHEQICE